MRFCYYFLKETSNKDNSEHNHKVLSSEQKDLLTSYMQQLTNVNMSDAPKLKPQRHMESEFSDSSLTEKSILSAERLIGRA